jgi:hypothetical protein
VHDGLLAFGAKEFGSVDEIEDEVLREQEEEEKRSVLLSYVPLDVVLTSPFYVRQACGGSSG